MKPPQIWPPVPDWLTAVVLALSIAGVTGWLGPALDMVTP
jgi:hypothetical protein